MRARPAPLRQGPQGQQQGDGTPQHPGRRVPPGVELHHRSKRFTTPNMKRLFMRASLDLPALLSPGGELPGASTVDGIHLTGPAYQAWAEAVRQTINPTR